VVAKVVPPFGLVVDVRVVTLGAIVNATVVVVVVDVIVATTTVTTNNVSER
jgi:hypothetical protein